MNKLVNSLTARAVLRSQKPLFFSVGVMLATALTLTTSRANAHGPYVVLRDDGTLAKTISDTEAVTKEIVPLYKATGAKMPDVISIWTNFPIEGDPDETLFDPVSNAVSGIGLGNYFGGDGTFKSPAADVPLDSILLHNDVTTLPQRAQDQGTTITDYAQYIFMLEFAHQWGPLINVPADDGGSPTELIGFQFHWSFFYDPGGMTGGNAWTNNNDGTFTVSGQGPTTIKYSMLELYLMGLADATEVPPFGVLENVVLPATPTDPLLGGAYSNNSFPYWGTTPYTVTATRRTLTIDDVIAANGTRSPTVADSPKSFDVGFALVVAQDATDADIATAEAAYDGFVSTLPDAFQKATGGRGSLNVLTADIAVDAGTDAGASEAPDADADASAPIAAPAPAAKSGCEVSPTPNASELLSPLAGIALVLAARAHANRRKKQARRA